MQNVADFYSTVTRVVRPNVSDRILGSTSFILLGSRTRGYLRKLFSFSFSWLKNSCHRFFSSSLPQSKKNQTIFFFSFSVQEELQKNSLHDAMAIYIGAMDGNSVKFSPLLDFRIAVAARDHILDQALVNIHDLSDISFPIASLVRSTHDLIYDVSWSSYNHNHIVTAGDDHVAHLLDVTQGSDPIKSFNGHSRVIRSIEWKPQGESFATASQDGTVKYWNIHRDRWVQDFPHLAAINSISWNHIDTNQFATSSSDGSLRTFDTRSTSSPTRFIHADSFRIQILSCDWSTQDEHCIATSSNNYIRIWDLRSHRTPVKVLDQAHRALIRRIKFSPQRKYEIASCSNDSKVVVWDWVPAIDIPIMTIYDHHQGPVTGLDISRRIEGLMTSTGYDGLVRIWLHAQPKSCRP